LLCADADIDFIKATTTATLTTSRDDPTTTTASTTTAPQQSQQQPTEPPKSSSSSSSWIPKKRTEYSLRLLPHKIRLELCLTPSSSSLHDKEDNTKTVDDGAPFATSSSSSTAVATAAGSTKHNVVVLGGTVDTRRSTRVIFSHIDDLVARDDLDIYSYELLTARFHSEYDADDDDEDDDTGDAAAASEGSMIATGATTTTRPTSSSFCFAQANLHPSRLCRIPNIVDSAVLALLPKNSIIVHFSDQSVRVAPYLYQLLRAVHEKYVTVREERIFTDTAFSSLDQHTVQKQKPTATSPDITASKEDKHQRQLVHQSDDGSNRTNNNNDDDEQIDKKEKPTPVAVELNDLRTENELLSRELERQEAWLQEELSNNDNVQTKTLPALQATLNELQQQNAQLQIELDRRQQRAEYLEFVLHSERIRLIREVSLLYDINTTTTTTMTTPSANGMNGDHTTLTIRGMNLSANGVISFINHLVHILLPKYLGVYVRPPPPSPTPLQRTAAQRTLVWQATLQCLARHIGLPLSSSTTTNQQTPANVLHSIREIYDHMLQYRKPDHNDDPVVVVVDRSGS
jgi:hypothetical protein